VIELKTPSEIEAMRPAGRFVADVLTALKEKAAVGVNLLELDELAHDMIRASGATSCYIDYHPSFGASPFGKVLCTSVNDAVLHGLPYDYTLVDGDLLSVDFAASVNGWVADSALSVVVGTPREEDLEVIAATEEALAKAIDVAVVGNKIGDIAATIGAVAKEHAWGVNTDFGGHGVGRTMHGEPHIPTLVHARHRQDLHRPRRLDAPLRRWVPRRTLRAHDRDHPRRPGGPHRAQLTVRRSAVSPPAAPESHRWRSGPSARH
jgi:methionyl aminopeptidase